MTRPGPHWFSPFLALDALGCFGALGGHCRPLDRGGPRGTLGPRICGVVEDGFFKPIYLMI